MDRATKIRASRLKSKTSFSVKQLHDALKLARGFERQKLGRRQKTATKQKNQEDLDRLKEEVLALKALDLTKLAEKHMLKQYVKTKRIHDHPAFKAAYGENVNVDPPKSPAEANILARLFSSNPVKQKMPRIMAGVLEVLGLEDLGALNPEAPKNSKSDQKDRERRPGLVSAAKEGQNETASSDESEFQGFPDDDSPANHVEEAKDSGSEGDEEVSDSDIDEMDLDQYNDRLASSSESGSDADHDDDAFIPDLVVTAKMNGELKKSGEHISRDLSISPFPSPSPSPEPEPQQKSKPKTAAKATAKPTTSTTFLPSLTMGGYFSGSESGSDIQPVDDAIPQPRKNRRGQRARQLIAERKYGKNAKHLAKAKEKGQEVNWDTKRGAVVGGGDKGRKGWKGRDGKGDTGRGRPTANEGRDNGMNKGRGPKISGANDIAMGKTRTFGSAPGAGKADENKPLHPSWEAAKKRKQEKAAAGKFEGKKITFD